MTYSAATTRQVSNRGLLPVALAVAAAWVVLALVPTSHGLATFAAMWLAMSVAMMVPTVMRPMQRAAAGSPRRAWLFLGGFVAVWFVVGVPAYLLMNAIAWTPAWIFATWMAAGAYQLTPWMQRNLTDCRSVRFDGEPLRYGLRQGMRCIASCGPVMLAVMVTAMALPSVAVSLLLLIAVTVAICWEKRPRTNSRWVAAVGLALLLVGAGGLVLGGGSSAPMHHSGGTSTS